MVEGFKRALAGAVTIATLLAPQATLANHLDGDTWQQSRVSFEGQTFDSRFFDDGRFVDFSRDRFGFRDGILLLCRRVTTGSFDGQIFICRRIR